MAVQSDLNQDAAHQTFGAIVTFQWEDEPIRRSVGTIFTFVLERTVTIDRLA